MIDRDRINSAAARAYADIIGVGDDVRDEDIEDLGPGVIRVTERRTPIGPLVDVLRARGLDLRFDDSRGALVVCHLNH